jgi:hypothetical protein
MPALMVIKRSSLFACCLAMAIEGFLMAPWSGLVIAAMFLAAVVLAFVLDFIKVAIFSRLGKV